MRSPYDGWEQHASNPKDYVSYLLKCGYTVSDTYLNDVLNLVPRAVALLAGASVHPESAPTRTTPAIVRAPRGVRRPGGTKAPTTKAAIGKIDAEHWLTSAKRTPIDGGGLLTPLYVVIHYTEGFYCR